MEVNEALASVELLFDLLSRRQVVWSSTSFVVYPIQTTVPKN